MNDQQKQEKWEQWRTGGFFRFFLKMGILAFAIPVTVILQVFNYISRYGLTSSGFGEVFTIRHLVEVLLFMFLEGLIFATILWFYQKRKFPKVVP